MNMNELRAEASKMVHEQCTAFGVLSLGVLIRKLGRCKPGARVLFDFCCFVPGSLDSYRGYYDHLAFDPVADKARTVEDVLGECRNALGKTFTGYKGGYFTMDESTPIWVSSYGNADGTGVVGVRELEGGDTIILQTAHCENY